MQENTVDILYALRWMMDCLVFSMSSLSRIKCTVSLRVWSFETCEVEGWMDGGVDGGGERGRERSSNAVDPDGG